MPRGLCSGTSGVEGLSGFSVPRKAAPLMLPASPLPASLLHSHVMPSPDSAHRAFLPWALPVHRQQGKPPPGALHLQTFSSRASSQTLSPFPATKFVRAFEYSISPHCDSRPCQPTALWSHTTLGGFPIQGRISWNPLGRLLRIIEANNTL